jgi:two-component system, NarL family, nitrate/nitrite response regulator NarL
LTITVLLVDDHIIVRKGIGALLRKETSFQIVGEASNGEEGLALVRELQPGVMVLDIVMPGIDGLEVLRRMQESQLPTRVVILTGYSNEEYVLDAFKNGAYGYVMKEDFVDHLIRAVKNAASGNYYISPSVKNNGLK